MSIEQEIASLKRYVDDLITGLYWNTEARLDQLEQDVHVIFEIQVVKLRLRVMGMSCNSMSCRETPALMRVV